MSMHVAIHRPVSLHAMSFCSGGEVVGRVELEDAAGAKIEIYTTPEAARAMADAFNAAMADPTPEPA